MADVICKEVVITTLARRGDGVPGDPVRGVTQVYDKDGTLIAEHDHFKANRYKIANLAEFAKWVIRNKVDELDVNEALAQNWADEYVTN